MARISIEAAFQRAREVTTMWDRAIFEDRRDAGQQLAGRLTSFRDQHPIVLGLPRGGVVVAFEVARLLGAPLDVVVARKLGAPMQPELGIGAIAPGGIRVLDEYSVRALGLTDDQIAAVESDERAEMERRLERYRGSREMPEVEGRTVIIVDDGLATGVTATAAIRAVRAKNPKRLVLAIPVCAKETSDLMREEVDEFVCVSIPDTFRAVGVWYRNFTQTTDAEVIELLEEARDHASVPAIHEI